MDGHIKIQALGLEKIRLLTSLTLPTQLPGSLLHETPASPMLFPVANKSDPNEKAAKPVPWRETPPGPQYALKLVSFSLFQGSHQPSVLSKSLFCVAVF